MSSVYLCRVNQIRLDGISAMDMPTTMSPSKFTYMTPNKRKDTVQPVPLSLPSTTSYADIQVITYYFFYVSCFMSSMYFGAGIK